MGCRGGKRAAIRVDSHWYTRGMYGLLDCNNFFVSCERLFRPDLLGRPVGVLSSNDGCIVARSQELKDLGVPMGEPYFKIRDLCRKEGVVLFSSNFTLYRDISSRVMHALREEVDDVDVYSIDEAFFTLRKEVTEAEVMKIRTNVMQKTGIPVSIGVAPTHTLAKHGSDLAKRGKGVHIFNEAEWHEQIKDIWCSSIWGVGRQSAETLRKGGINMVSDLLHAHPVHLRSLLGINGVRLQLELKGISAHEGAARDLKQSIMSSRSFKKESKALSVIESAIGYHASSIAEELRSTGLLASKIRVSIRANRFGEWAEYSKAAEAVLEVPSAGTSTLLEVALTLARSLFVPGVPYKKVGVSVGGLIGEGVATGSLFIEHTPRLRAGTLDPLIDALNARFGRGTVRNAVIMNTDKWQPSSELRSAAYTTRWGEIPTVLA